MATRGAVCPSRTSTLHPPCKSAFYTPTTQCVRFTNSTCALYVLNSHIKNYFVNVCYHTHLFICVCIFTRLRLRCASPPVVSAVVITCTMEWHLKENLLIVDIFLYVSCVNGRQTKNRQCSLLLHI